MSTPTRPRGSNGLAKSLHLVEDLPPVTDAQRREAFAQMRWAGREYAQTMQDPVYARIVEIRATLIRNREYRAAKGGDRGQPAQAPEQPARRTQHNFSTYPPTPRIF